MYKKISDYGIIGNLHSVALVGLDGSIDWLCLPHIDSPSVFGALLDHERGGRFSLRPLGEWDSAARYLPGTNILETRFRTRGGVVRVTDFMPIPIGGPEELEEEQHELYRLAEGVRGRVGMEILFEPRFDYARARTLLTPCPGGLRARGGQEALTLSCPEALSVRDGRGACRFDLSPGSRVWLHLRYGEEDPRDSDPARAERCLEETAEYWRRWLKRGETGRTVDLGPYRDRVDRSALVLKLLYYEPAGTLAAAATTSLPEEVGGVRNWDYRYTWVRDASFTLQALFRLGHLSEMHGFLKWIEKLLAEHGAGRMQIMYGLRGETGLAEEELPHLEGYKGSRPVRIGNGAAGQRQLDIYGEVLDAALSLSDYVGKVDMDLWVLLRDICETAAEGWREKDSGIWEVRGEPGHFVYSKVMCWVALDRGLKIARRYGFPADLERWEKEAGEIREAVLARGWREERKAFVQREGADALDASSLLLPILGFLPFDDPRVASTIEAVRRELEEDGFLYRYRSPDGLAGKEGTFLLCAFWLIRCLIGQGKIEEAEHLLHRVEGASNHLGLFSEQYGVEWREALGNFPQAFTHIGYINCVVALRQAKARDAAAGEPAASRVGLLFSRRVVLNDGEPGRKVPPRELSRRLKDEMNLLRGAFFDAQQGRVAYERMEKSPAYRDTLELSRSLQGMDPGELSGRAEGMAFWINLYNVIVIHGVIALGIRDSVKEVRNFFRRVEYQIGGLSFSPDDIEHGVLRGNRRPPGALFRRFGDGDPRLPLAIDPLDPRVHFALVCASSSCPPIEAYTAENLDEELTLAGRTFLSTGAVRIDRERGRVSLSRIFKWYGEDFGQTEARRLRFIAPFLYDRGEGEFLAQNAGSLKVDYQDYDWRLNRG